MKNIRLCKETDRSKLMEYLQKNAPMNLFFIGDVENFGLEQDFCKVYVEEDEAGICSAYMIYRDNVCITSDGAPSQEFVNQLLEEYSCKYINGEKRVMNQLQFPESYEKEECYYACLKHPIPETSNQEVVPLEVKDAQGLWELRKEAFGGDDTLESIQTVLTNKGSHQVGIFQDGQLVSSAGSTAECSNLAMIVGVCTKKGYEGKGYASACVTKLCNQRLAQGQTCCLFYNNPNAAKIYKKCGFQDIGFYTMEKKVNGSNGA